MRYRLCGLALVALFALTPTSAPAQTIEGLAPPTKHLKLDVARWLPPEPRASVARDTNRKLEPLLPLEPILDHLPLQTIEELLRTERRLVFTVDKYRVTPRVRFHEIGIVITRPMP